MFETPILCIAMDEGDEIDFGSENHFSHGHSHSLDAIRSSSHLEQHQKSASMAASGAVGAGTLGQNYQIAVNRDENTANQPSSTRDLKQQQQATPSPPVDQSLPALLQMKEESQDYGDGSTTFTITATATDATTTTVTSAATSNIMNTTCAISITNSATSNTIVGGRKISITKDQFHQLPPILQRLALDEMGDVVTDEDCRLCFISKRHQENIGDIKFECQPWRIRERMKTASVALVLCLNIGVDPPDVIKIQPCARLECWIDPTSVSAPKAMDLIGTNLQMQYERWQPRARYKKCHDPTADDVKKLCTSLRRNAKGERILFHYNGHGVPKPTANGEIWVFNKTFTQYIPLSIFELQNWMSAPSVYVYDCSNAGIIIQSYLQFAEQHETEYEKLTTASGQRGAGGASATTTTTTGSSSSSQFSPMISYKNCIHLAACSVNEILPMNAQLPADLFTSCLTTPIIIALKWYTVHEHFGLIPKLHAGFIDKIPGKVNDRRTMMGELNWIFTAITDTIAWNTLPRELFQKLFRQDLLVASLFRNFLLAERILRSHDCTPISFPALPPCFRHSMWTAWDLVVDLALRQLPDILEHNAPYKQLPFFEEQLTAFQVWLDRESTTRSCPEQLPIVLQVLLSQVHRLRALELLARFLDLGPWAVNLALGVGIFPYVLKLLQSSAKELRPVLVFIWAKILAVDPTCQVDLVKENKYFLSVLQDTSVAKEYRILSAFVLASIVNNFLLGQTSALQGSLLSICLEQLSDESWLLRQWLVICLGMLWQNFEKARWSGVRDLAHEKLYPLLKDPIPEVRAAAVFALGTFISSVTDRAEEHANNIDRIIAITLIENVSEDVSPLVRRELAAALQWMVLLFESQFVSVYMQDQLLLPSSGAVNVLGERSASISHTVIGVAGMNVVNHANSTHTHHTTRSLERHASMRRGISSGAIANTNPALMPYYSIFLKLWHGIHQLAYDPHPMVADTAQRIVKYIRDAALYLITAKEAVTSGASSFGGVASGSSEKCVSLSMSLPPSPNARLSYLDSGHGEISPEEGGLGLQGAIQANVSYWASKIRNVTNEPVLPHHHAPTGPCKLRTTSMNEETDSGIATTQRSLGDSFIKNGSGDGLASGRSSNSETNYEGKSQNLNPIVTTDFILWTISYFTKSGKERYAMGKGNEHIQVFPLDKNSHEVRKREWRYERNRVIRQEAREQLQQDNFKIQNQIWMRKTQHTPAIIKLLPYDEQIAVAYREKVLIYDWQQNTVRTFAPAPVPPISVPTRIKSLMTNAPQFSAQSSVSRVTSLEFLNAQDSALTLVAHENGVIRVWQSNEASSNEDQSRLVTAWVAMPSLISHGFSSGMGSASSSLSSTSQPSNMAMSSGGSTSATSLSPAPTTSKYTRKEIMAGSSGGVGGGGGVGGSGVGGGYQSGIGLVTTWQQHSQQLIVGGECCRNLRVWDLERELCLNDIPIGTDSNVRVLAAFPTNIHSDLIGAGCEDGSVRLYDKRCNPNEARIRVYHEHSASLLNVCLKDNQTTMITACSQGKVCVIDLRARSHSSSIIHQMDVGSDVTAIVTHQAADIMACGSANKITIYNTNPCVDRTCNILRYQEGFMGHKPTHSTCLAFHTYKLSLAAGFMDNTFYKNCSRWQREVNRNPQTKFHMNEFLNSDEVKSALKGIQEHIGVSDLNIKTIRTMYSICKFETAWRHRCLKQRGCENKEEKQPPSVWCQLLKDEKTFRTMEFIEDLIYYWKDGYGDDLTKQIACPAVRDMLHHIAPDSTLPNVTLYFSHSGTILKLLVAFGLYKDSSHLTYQDFHRQRLWQTSIIDSFASNLAFVTYSCKHPHPLDSMVLTLHQERPIKLPGCSSGEDYLCPWTKLNDLFKSTVDNCHLKTLCEVKQEITKTSGK